MSILVRINIIGTGLFVVSATLATLVFTSVFRTLGVVVALALFTVGVASFIWGYFTAVQQSRYSQISVASLFLLTGEVANRKVRWLMNGCLVVQGSCGLLTALARTSTDGRPGSTLAFGVLVPLFGVGLNGLWASRYGSFSPLDEAKTSTEYPVIGKDGDHG